MNLHRKSPRERVEIIGRRIRGRWVCWRRGYHLDGGTIGHWDDWQRCRDCRDNRFLKPMPGSWGHRRHNRPWGPPGDPGRLVGTPS